MKLLSVWPPVAPLAYASAPSGELPFPYGEPGCVPYEWGRHAVWHGLRALGIGAGSGLLVPAYHHGAEVEAIRRAGVGCHFYDADEALSPDAEELERKLTPRVRGLFLTHYLGFPQDGARWRAWCDERGLCLIEDVALSWPASDRGGPVGRHGDASIFSPWKAVGLRDTGLLLAPGAAPLERPPPRRRIAARSLFSSHSAWLAQRFALGAKSRGVGPSAEADLAAPDYALSDPDSGPSASSTFLLRRLWTEKIPARRRANYRRLLDRLAQFVPAPFDELPPGAFPMAFPIAGLDGERTVAALAERGVEAWEMWNRPHPLLPPGYPGAARRRRECLLVPVHQGLRDGDVDRIADAVEAVVGIDSEPVRVSRVPADAAAPVR